MTDLGFENGRTVSVTEFDYDAVDRGDPLTAELEGAAQNQSDDATTLGRVFSLLLTYGGSDSAQFFITANVLAFIMGLHPNQRSGGVEIARGLGMEKAAWFRRVNQMRNILRARGAELPKIVGEWSKQARQTIKQATIKTHENRKANRHTNGHSAGYTKRFGRAIEATGIGN